jgi:glycosyltransferase involved in cell wall biosynthesis
MKGLAQKTDRKSSSAPNEISMDGCIWITWENQRRTYELARALSLPLFKYISKRNYIVRIAGLSAKTILLLFRRRPKKLVVQNPSIILATVACLFKNLLGYILVVDRHSNFRIEKAPYRSIKEKVFQLLSRYTIRKADLTIVTNEFLKNIVEQWGGRGFVLQDKLPSLVLAKKVQLKGLQNIIFVCSFSGDEPVNEVIEAARLIDQSIVIYITGNNSKLKKDIIDGAPKNIIFTGFMDEKMYQSVLYSSDAVMALTTADHFLLCAAYEALALGRSLILSRTPDLMEYFHQGAIFTKNDAESLASAIRTALAEKGRLEQEAAVLRRELVIDWQEKFCRLAERINTL